MIAFLEGTVAEKKTDSLSINVNGVGFLVRTTSQTLARAGARGEKIFVYTTMVVREDAMELFGFITREEKEMFGRLTSVTGIGPRTALGVLSALSAGDIAIAIATGDAKTLARAPGIGPKSAQRMILELKDRITADDLSGPGLPTLASDAPGDAAQEALLALVALGYTSSEAAKALQGIRDQADTPDQLVLLALRRLGGGA